MGKKLKFDDFADSQFAIKQYIDYKDENAYIHDAKVIISSKGRQLYNGVIRAVASIETNESFVQLVGDGKFDRDFYSRYVNEYQKFKFINGTLLIQAKDRWGNSIEIDIT